MYLSKETFSPRSSRVFWLWKVFCTLQMDDTVLTMTGRTERPGEGRLQEKETETKEQGKGVAHLLRPSKAPHWSWNANPFYFPLTLMEITSLILDFHNKETSFCKDKHEELYLLKKKKTL